MREKALQSGPQAATPGLNTATKTTTSVDADRANASAKDQVFEALQGRFSPRPEITQEHLREGSLAARSVNVAGGMIDATVQRAFHYVQNVFPERPGKDPYFTLNSAPGTLAGHEAATYPLGEVFTAALGYTQGVMLSKGKNLTDSPVLAQVMKNDFKEAPPLNQHEQRTLGAIFRQAQEYTTRRLAEGGHSPHSPLTSRKTLVNEPSFNLAG